MIQWRQWLWVLGLGLAAGQHALGQGKQLPEESSMPFNLSTPTLGGRQFWSDVLHFHKWRIQENVLTGHYRLLDGKNVRRAWGSFDECTARLNAIKLEQSLPPMQGDVVLVLHGLGRGWAMMDPLVQHLETQGFTVCNVSYASTRRGVAEHARSLARIVENLEGVSGISFVAHSMGNIVVRRFLYDQTDPATGALRDGRFRRMVMLAPPNQGAQLATRLGELGIFKVITGNSGQQLGVAWDELQQKLATPPFEFGIIAGTGHPLTPSNPLIEGEDDFLVAVEETKLAGACDFLVLPTNHTLIVRDEAVLSAVATFLKSGYFVSAERRQPLPEPDGHDSANR